MANEVTYSNVSWGEDTPISGERLATNGAYTGQHKGTPMQDATQNADNDAYLVERTTIRLGTIMGDAADQNFPTIAEAEEESEGEGEGGSEGETEGETEGEGSEGSENSEGSEGETPAAESGT